VFWLEVQLQVCFRRMHGCSFCRFYFGCHACREMPGELEKVMIWFRDYKIPDGKPANAYGYDSRPMNSDFAKMVIGETHELYNNLKEGKRENNGGLALS